MTKRMLIDAAHPEETRVVVLDGQRLEEFDFETSTKKQIKGNIYLAKVTRVEPSLQAAFVEYGGNRHGFLAFGEIHPDYYRIPVADRQAAIAAERADEAAADEREDRGVAAEADDEDRGGIAEAADADEPERRAEDAHLETTRADEDADSGDSDGEEDFSATARVEPVGSAEPPSFEAEPPEGDAFAEDDAIESDEPAAESETALGADSMPAADRTLQIVEHQDVETVETVGGDEIEETTRPRARYHRHYKIQEVIKRRQIMLVQVTKEERGNKGAALTTYISLAGRYCVLMPNTPRGGGVSRKITSIADRRRLKDLMADLEVPEGMGVIVRTAGSERSKVEIKRDFEYLLRLWDEIRDLTLKSTAPALIYEEGNLIKRSIRDLYASDIDEVLVDGKEGYETAKAFMQMLMPNHTKRVRFYNDPTVPLLHRFQVEGQLDAIHSPVVQLRSGGYIVINPTEALVAIDVNSGRSTRERNIEETALKTNSEAAEEIARQLRLRDLAGLIVIDFIDMEERRNNSAVERRIKDAMRYDRARIQLGRISPFGLLELSRQRLRPSLLEASTAPCPHCGGTGHIRSTESTALHVLRAIEEEGMRRRSAEITLAVPSSVALYILNQKRAALLHTEARYGFRVTITEDNTLIPPAFRLDRTKPLSPAEIAALPVFEATSEPMSMAEEAESAADELLATGVESGEAPEPAELSAEPAAFAEGGTEESGLSREETAGDLHGHGQSEGPGRHRRRRRRRGGERSGGTRAALQPLLEAAPGEAATAFPVTPDETGEAGEAQPAGTHPEGAEPGAGGENGDRKRRRRGRRGGRRRRRDHGTGTDHGMAGLPDAANEPAGTALPDFAGPEFEPPGFEPPELESRELVSPHHTAPPPILSASVQEQAAPESNPPPPMVEPQSGPLAAPNPNPPPVEQVARKDEPPLVQEVVAPPAHPRRGWWRRG